MSIGDKEALREERRSGDGGQTEEIPACHCFFWKAMVANLERITNRIMNYHERFCARRLDDILPG